MENTFPFDTKSEDELILSATKEILNNIQKALVSAKSLKEQHQWLQHKSVVEKMLEKRGFLQY